jgi:hypothetical protein
MKVCTCCGEEKDLSAFPWRDGKKTKLHAWCKPCKVAAQRQWEQCPKVRAKRADYERRRGAAVAARLSMRRAQMASATPPWLTEEHREQMRAVYVHAADCALTSGYRYEVDHIIPLFAEGICGLHVPWNLQVLPHDLNARKRNVYDEPDRLR